MSSGFVESQMEVIGLQGLSDSVATAPLPQDEYGLYHDAGFFTGSMQQIIEKPEGQDYGGERGFSFVDDFYFRIYVLPTSLDFGAIVTTTTRDIQVWNAYFTPVTLESIVLQFGTEVTNEGDPVPAVISALVLKSWPFRVTPEGPPDLEDTATFTFDTGEVFNIEIQGTRSVLWPFLPNWRESVKVTSTYLTDVFTARSGREQRTAFRKYPRKELEFTISLNDARRQKFRRLMASWQDRPFIVADVTRNELTTTEMLAGGTTVEVGTPLPWMVEDRAVVLTKGTGANQTSGLRVIDEVDSNGTLTFKDTDEVDWPVGTRVYAGVVANLNDETQAKRLTTTALETTVKFDILPGTEGAFTAPAAPMTLNGKEIFLFKPNWGEDVSDLNRHITEYVDYNIGRLQRTSPISYATQVWQQTFLGTDTDTIQLLLDVFDRAKGQQGEFYAPTWENDLTPKERLVGATSEMRVEGLDLFNAYEADASLAGVLVELNDGTLVMNALDEIVEINDGDGDDTKLTFLSAWADDIELADIKQVSWIRCWRFATDDLTAEYLTNSTANLVISMQSIEDLPVDPEDSNSA